MKKLTAYFKTNETITALLTVNSQNFSADFLKTAKKFKIGQKIVCDGKIYEIYQLWQNSYFNAETKITTYASLSFDCCQLNEKSQKINKRSFRVIDCDNKYKFVVTEKLPAKNKNAELPAK